MALVAAGVALLALIGSAGVGFYIGRTADTRSAERTSTTWICRRVPALCRCRAFTGRDASRDLARSNASARDSRLSVQTVAATSGSWCPAPAPDRQTPVLVAGQPLARLLQETTSSCAPTCPKFEPVVLCDAPDREGRRVVGRRHAGVPHAHVGSVACFGARWLALHVGQARAGRRRREDYPVSAGGDRFLCWAQFADRSLNEIRLASAPDRSISIVRSPRAAAFDGGTLYYVRDRDVVGQRLDLASSQLTGDVQRVRMEGPPPPSIGCLERGSWWRPCRHSNGARRSVPAGLGRSRTGAVETRIGEPGAYREMDISKDSRRLLVSESSSDGNRIWLTDLTSGARRLLVSLVGSELAALGAGRTCVCIPRVDRPRRQRRLVSTATR